MNQCTILFEDGHEIELQGEVWGQDFDVMSSEDLIAFVKTHLEQIRNVWERETDEWDHAADGQFRPGSSTDRDSTIYSKGVKV